VEENNWEDVSGLDGSRPLSDGGDEKPEKRWDDQGDIGKFNFDVSDMQ